MNLFMNLSIYLSLYLSNVWQLEEWHRPSACYLSQHEAELCTWMPQSDSEAADDTLTEVDKWPAHMPAYVRVTVPRSRSGT
jgi:hypothetical protein